MTVGSPPSRTVTTELVVPRSMPTARAMGMASLPCTGAGAGPGAEGSHHLARGPLNFPAHPNGSHRDPVPTPPNLFPRRPCPPPRRSRRIVAEAARTTLALATTPRLSRAAVHRSTRPASRAPDARHSPGASRSSRAWPNASCGVFTAADATPRRLRAPRDPALLSTGPMGTPAAGRLRHRPTTSRGRRNGPPTPGRLPRRRCSPSIGRGRPSVTARPRACGACPVPPVAATTLRLTDPDAGGAGAGSVMTRAPLRARRGLAVRTAPAHLPQPRTLIDCAREWPLDDAVVAMDAALLAGTRDDGGACRARPPRPRTLARAPREPPGRSRLADGRAESPLETRGRLRIVGVRTPDAGTSGRDPHGRAGSWVWSTPGSTKRRSPSSSTDG